MASTNSIPSIKITAPKGNLHVDTNLIYLSIKDGDTVTWEIDVEDGMCVEIVFCQHCGVMGPFTFGDVPTNPARGWYKAHGRKDVGSNALDGNAAKPGSIWKYDVVLYDRDTGQEIARQDPYIKVGE
jgi:hypothetical protein